MSNDERIYSIKERVDALLALEANNGNISKTSRELDISRPTLSKWRDEKNTIFADYRNLEKMEKVKVDDESVVQTDSDGNSGSRALDLARDKHYQEIIKFGKTYQERKGFLAQETEMVAIELIAQVRAALSEKEVSPKDAMQMYAIAIDKLGKLMGEPDKVIAIKSAVKEHFVSTLFRAVDMGLIEFTGQEAKVRVADMFDNIEDAEYEDL